MQQSLLGYVRRGAERVAGSALRAGCVGIGPGSRAAAPRPPPGLQHGPAPAVRAVAGFALGWRAGARALSTGDRPSKAPRESLSFAAEIVGNSSLAGKGIRISAGEVLKVIDLAASYAACLHAGHPTCTTLAFDHVELLVPILHGDLLHLDSRVAYVGKTSIVVQVVGRKWDLLTRKWMYTLEAYVTFVSLGPDKRPTVVPHLVTETEEEEELRAFLEGRKRLNEQYESEQLALHKPGAIDDFMPDLVNDGHNEYVRMSDTTLMLRKNFLPRALNHLGTVFGGDLLEWMESAAVACASHFTRNQHLITIAMDRVFFHKPIRATDVLELKAVVAYSRRHCMQVEVQVDVLTPPWVQRPEEGLALNRSHSHRGRFHVLSLSEAGYKQPVGIGLKMLDDDERLRYAKASHAFNFWRNQRETAKSFNRGMYGEGVSHLPWGVQLLQ